MMRFPSQTQVLAEREPVPAVEDSHTYSRHHSDGGGSNSATVNGDASNSARSGAGALETSSEPSNSHGGDCGGDGGGRGCARRRGQLDPRFDVRRNPARPQRGRGVFAVEAVPAGTEVMVARQAVAVPRDRYRAAFCRRCLSLLDKTLLIKCRRCEDRFCGKECVIAAAGEGTHEATCAFVEGLGDECLERLSDGDSCAAKEREILRLTMECLARRGAGLSDEEEWVEIEDLDLGGGVADGDDAGVGVDVLDDAVIREAQARLNNRGLEVFAEEIQTVHRRLRRNFHGVQPEPLGRLVPPTVVAVFPAASLVNHSCEPNACFHARRAGGDGPPLEYILRSTTDIAAGEEVCVSYLAHFANAATEEGRQEFLEKVWGFSCDCPRCEEDTPPGCSPGDWRVCDIFRNMETLLLNSQSRSSRETQTGLRCSLEQGLQVLLAGPDISSRLKIQLAMRIDEIAIRRRMHGSLRFRTAQELAERLVSVGLDSGYTADLRFTMHREALRWAADARLEGSYRRGEQMMRASRDSLEEAIKVAVIYLGEGHPKTRALVECLRRFSPLHSV